MEHRWGRRRRLILRVRFLEAEHAVAMGWLTDVSLSGGYVTTTAGLAIMSQVTLEVDEHGTSSASSRSLRLQGRVVRHGPTGLGIEWEEFASETLIQTVRIATSIHPFPIGPRPLPELSNCTIYGASHDASRWMRS